MDYLFIYIDSETKQLQYYDMSNNSVVELDKREIPSNKKIRFFGVFFLGLILFVVRKFDDSFNLSVSLFILLLITVICILSGFLYSAYRMNNIQNKQIVPIKKKKMSTSEVISNMDRQSKQEVQGSIFFLFMMIILLFLFFYLNNILFLFGLFFLGFFVGNLLQTNALINSNKKKLTRYWIDKKQM